MPAPNAIGRPIIFSTDSVRAILSGHKRQTRRLVRIRPKDGMCATDCAGPEPERAWADPGLGNGGYLKVPCKDGAAQRIRCRYSIGDRLWVRETFVLESNYGVGDPEECPPPHNEGRPILWEDVEDHGRVWTQPHYKATDPDPHVVSVDAEFGDDRTRWRPSIYMPRWASRITLEVLAVRVQRLQDISEEDAVAEGVTWEPGQQECNIRKWGERQTGRMRFADIWDHINAKRAPWASNCWVWAITFKVLL